MIIARWIVIFGIAFSSFVKCLDDDSFPVISWYELSRIPFTSSSGSSAPSCIDFDGDGDFDCFVGTASGDVEYYENVGSSSAFTFTHDSSYDILDAVTSYSKPVAADFNNDGYVDLYVGSYQGSVAWYMNEGDGTFTEQSSDVFGSAIKQSSASSPSSMRQGMVAFAGSMIMTSVTTAVSVGALGSLFMLDGVEAASGTLGTHAAPSCADLDGDGDLDCIVGYSDGSCALFRNDGSPEVASFTLIIQDLFKSSYGDLTMASPFLHDFDQDGNVDVAVGYDEGQVYYYKNNLNALPKITRSDFSLESTDLFNSTGAVKRDAAPWCGHTDGDTLIECFIGSHSGDVIAYDSELPGPTPAPTTSPSMQPSALPTIKPTPAPTTSPSMQPSALPTLSVHPTVSSSPSSVPTSVPTGDGGGGGGDTISLGSVNKSLFIAVIVLFGVLICIFAWWLLRRNITFRTRWTRELPPVLDEEQNTCEPPALDHEEQNACELPALDHEEQNACELPALDHEEQNACEPPALDHEEQNACEPPALDHEEQNACEPPALDHEEQNACEPPALDHEEQNADNEAAPAPAPQNEQHADESPEPPTCVICFEGPREMIALPCCHLQFCAECVERLKRPVNPAPGSAVTCPTCNTKLNRKKPFRRVYQ